MLDLLGLLLLPYSVAGHQDILNALLTQLKGVGQGNHNLFLRRKLLVALEVHVPNAPRYVQAPIDPSLLRNNSSCLFYPRLLLFILRFVLVVQADELSFPACIRVWVTCIWDVHCPVHQQAHQCSTPCVFLSVPLGQVVLQDQLVLDLLYLGFALGRFEHFVHFLECLFQCPLVLLLDVFLVFVKLLSEMPFDEYGHFSAFVNIKIYLRGHRKCRKGGYCFCRSQTIKWWCPPYRASILS